MSRYRWNSCAATGVDTMTPEALFAHLCDSHHATVQRCERRHFFACEWRGCYELVPCPGSKGETLLCAVKGHLLDHAEYRPKSLGALRTLKATVFVSSPSEPEAYATVTAAAVVVPTPTATPPPHIHIPRLRPPSCPELGSPTPPSLSVSVPYSHPDAAPSPSSSTMTPRVGALTGRTISPTSDLPPPLVPSLGPGAPESSGFATSSGTWKCKWSTCTIHSAPFANAEDLLSHVLEVHVRPKSPNTPRDVVTVTDTLGRTVTWRKVTCKWSESHDHAGECNEEVVIRAKYVAHFQGHIFADCELEHLERFGSTSPVRLTSVPLIPPPPPTPKRQRGRPRKADLPVKSDAEMDGRPLKKRFRGNDALDAEGTIVVRWGGSGGLSAPVPLTGSDSQPSSSQLEPEDPSSQLSPSEIDRGYGSPRGSTTDSEEEDEELDWSLS